jgi:hypothetical protein
MCLSEVADNMNLSSSLFSPLSRPPFQPPPNVNNAPQQFMCWPLMPVTIPEPSIPSKDNLLRLKNEELKMRLRALGLPVTGNKEVLSTRLLESLQQTHNKKSTEQQTLTSEITTNIVADKENFPFSDDDAETTLVLHKFRQKRKKAVSKSFDFYIQY